MCMYIFVCVPPHFLFYHRWAWDIYPRIKTICLGKASPVPGGGVTKVTVGPKMAPSPYADISTTSADSAGGLLG